MENSSAKHLNAYRQEHAPIHPVPTHESKKANLANVYYVKLTNLQFASYEN